MIILTQRELLIEGGVNIVPHFADGKRRILHKFTLIAVADFMQDNPLRGDVIKPAFANRGGGLRAPVGIIVSRSDAMFIRPQKVAVGNILIPWRIWIIA